MLASHLPPAARQPHLVNVPAHLLFYRNNLASRRSSPGTGAPGVRQVRSLARARGPSTTIEWQGEERPSLHQLGAGGAGVAASATITTKPPQISTPAGHASPPLAAAIIGHSGAPLPLARALLASYYKVDEWELSYLSPSSGEAGSDVHQLIGEVAMLHPHRYHYKISGNLPSQITAGFSNILFILQQGEMNSVFKRQRI